MKSLLMRLSNSAMTIVMLAVFVVLLAIAIRYPAEARFMPLVVGIPAIALGLLQLVLDARDRRRAGDAVDTRSDFEKAQEQVSRMVGRQVDFEVAHTPLPGPAQAKMPQEEMVRRELVIWGYFLGFIGGILLFGFWVAIPIFLVAFLRFQAKASWRTALLLGLGGSIVLFFVFERGLKVSVHHGFVVEYALDRLAR